MTERRFVFGEAAELYDRARPGYPAQLVDDVLRFTAARRHPVRALEVGAGTGKATLAFAGRGLEILALEPSPEMAAVAARHFVGLPRVRLERSTFEDWSVQAAAFDLLFAAQSWHWVDPAVRSAKAARALAPGGALALFWHRVQWRGEPLRDELDELYRRVAPRLHAANPSFPGLRPSGGEDDLVRQLAAQGRFGELEMRTYPWPARLGAAALLDLLSSQSDHRLLAEAERERLLRAVGALVARRGGELEMPRDILLILARRDPR